NFGGRAYAQVCACGARPHAGFALASKKKLSPRLRDATGKPMADEDDELPQDDETPEPRLFSLTEAERTRRELEPVLIEAMECRKKLSGLDAELAAVAARIMMMGGVLVPHDRLALVRTEHTRLAQSLKSALDQILETGCVIKDLDVGLLDFPSVVD